MIKKRNSGVLKSGLKTLHAVSPHGERLRKTMAKIASSLHSQKPDTAKYKQTATLVKQ